MTSRRRLPCRSYSFNRDFQINALVQLEQDPHLDDESLSLFVAARSYPRQIMFQDTLQASLIPGKEVHDGSSDLSHDRRISNSSMGSRENPWVKTCAETGKVVPATPPESSGDSSFASPSLDEAKAGS